MAATTKLTMRVEETQSANWHRLVDTRENSRVKWNVPPADLPDGIKVGDTVKVTLTK